MARVRINDILSTFTGSPRNWLITLNDGSLGVVANASAPTIAALRSEFASVVAEDPLVELADFEARPRQDFQPPRWISRIADLGELDMALGLFPADFAQPALSPAGL